MFGHTRELRGPWGIRPRASKAVRRNALRPALAALEQRELLSGVADAFQPTAAEQYFLDQVNRARANPAAEGQRLVSLAQSDPVLKVATSGWDMGQFLRTISAVPPEAPLAFNTRLIEAARDQSAAMLAANVQFHSPSGYLTNPQVARADDGQAYYPTGNNWWSTGENVFAYSQNVGAGASTSAFVDYFAAAFLIDWGNPDFGHLDNELAPSPGSWSPGAGHYPYSEIGIGLLTGVSPTVPPGSNSAFPDNQGRTVGPAIVTQEFGWRSGNPILTGAAYLDADGNGRYGIGEGLGNVAIRATGRSGQGTFTATTWNSGGYSLPLTPGTYDVTASGGSLSSAVTTTVTLGKDNVWWDISARPGLPPADQPAPGDYSGTGAAALAVYRPATGQWFLAGQAQPVNFGGGGGIDLPLPGDYLGTGQTQPGLYRTTTAQWFVLGADGVGRSLGTFGSPGYDIPMPGDYDGNGKTEPAFYRPGTGQWFALGANGAGRLLGVLGQANLDIPMPGDYDGDGKTDAAVYRPTTGQWFVMGPDGTGRLLATLGQGNLDLPVPAAYDGHGKTEPAVYRPTTGQWFILGPTGVRTLNFGGANLDVPLKGDFDGDGKSDPALFRPSTGQWFLMDSSTGRTETRQYGQGGASSPISTWLDNYAKNPSPQIASSLLTPQGLTAGPGPRSARAAVPQAQAEQGNGAGATVVTNPVMVVPQHVAPRHRRFRLKPRGR